MTLYNTSEFGDPATWKESVRFVATAAWKQASINWDVNLFTTEMGYASGIEITGIDLLIACPEMDFHFASGMLQLLRHGVLSAPEEFEWEKLLLTREFIDAQQKAHKAAQERTSRLADLCIRINQEKLSVLAQQLTMPTTISDVFALQTKSVVLHWQYHRLMKLASACRSSGSLDEQLWNERIISGIESVGELTYED